MKEILVEFQVLVLVLHHHLLPHHLIRGMFALKGLFPVAILFVAKEQTLNPILLVVELMIASLLVSFVIFFASLSD
jgi:hypothetical protein